jgi:hypothetical protein
MASPDVIVSVLKDLYKKPELSRYDESLCADIQKRLDAKLDERNLSVTEKTKFV